MPNGHSPLARLWYHWVAPQHTHFIPQANLEAELDRLGLDVVERQGAEAHIVGVDFIASLLNVVTTLAPPVRWPWLPRPTPRALLRRRAAILALAPLFPLAILADLLVAVVVRATKGRYANNSYGIVARLREPEDAELVA